MFLCWTRHVAMDIDVSTLRRRSVVRNIRSIHVSWTDPDASISPSSCNPWTMRVPSLSLKGGRVCTQVLIALLRVNFIVLSHWSCLRMILTWRFYNLSNTFVTFPCSVTLKETWRERDDIMMFFLFFVCVFRVLFVFVCVFRLCVCTFFLKRLVF